MNVATVKTGRRGRPAYPRLVGYLYSTHYLLGSSPVLRLVSSSFDLFGEDSIFISPSSSLPAWVADDLAHEENPLVTFITSGKVSHRLVRSFSLCGIEVSPDVIPVYFGRVTYA